MRNTVRRRCAVLGVCPHRVFVFHDVAVADGGRHRYAGLFGVVQCTQQGFPRQERKPFEKFLNRLARLDGVKQSFNRQAGARKTRFAGHHIRTTGYRRQRGAGFG